MNQPMLNRSSRRTSAGFTLIELMIAVAIIAILAAIAIPSYQNYMTQTRRTEAQAALMAFAQAMERFYTQNNTYIGADGGTAAIANTFTAPAAAVYANQVPVEGGVKYYDLGIVNLTANSFELRANTTGVQANDGNVRILSNGRKEWDAANDGTWSHAWQ